MRLGILGAGSWGTALAILWSRNGHLVSLWARNPKNAEKFAAARCNLKYLPDNAFTENMNIQADLAATIAQSEVLGLAIPLQAYRGFLANIAPLLKETHKLLILSKGIEVETHDLPTQIVLSVLGDDWADRVFTLSGPSFAKEVAEDLPTAVVLAGSDPQNLQTLQEALNCPNFRLYRNRDVTGTELAGALKNVIAIAAGMAQGLNLGHNAIAGLITRGLSEISRLGLALGAKRETFAGLAGMGDLILTCKGELSRNLRVGLALAGGKSLEETLSDLGRVAEGVQTCRAARQLGRSLRVELPITEVVYQILYEGLAPMRALRALMSRSLKEEMHGYGVTENAGA